MCVVHLLNDNELRRGFDKNFQSLKIMHSWRVERGEREERNDSEFLVSHMTTKKTLGGMISPRDFISCEMRHVAQDEDLVSYTVATAVEDPEVPPGGEATRGETMFFAIVMTPLGRAEEGSSYRNYRVEYLCQVDLKGWLVDIGGAVTDGSIGALRGFLQHSAEHKELLEIAASRLRTETGAVE